MERLGWEEFMVVLPAEVVDFCCAAAGFAPRVAVRTSQMAAAPLFAAAGIGPALVPHHNVPSALTHLARPAPPRPIRAICAFTRGEWSTLTGAFLAALRDYPWGPKPRDALDLS